MSSSRVLAAACMVVLAASCQWGSLPAPSELDGGEQDAATQGADASEPADSGSMVDPDAGAPDSGSDEQDDAGPYAAFPAAPIVIGGAAAGVQYFGDPDAGVSSGGPCLTEPLPGSLFPQDFVRPRFAFSAPPEQNIFELRLRAEDQRHDLFVYTDERSWTMPGAMWSALTQYVIDKAITVSVRGIALDGGSLLSGPALGAGGSFTIAPVRAGGTLVYRHWGASEDTLKALKLGAEQFTGLLAAQRDAGWLSEPSATPDGRYVAGATSSLSYVFSSIDGTGQEPSFVSPVARSLLSRGFQTPLAFSPAHWTTGDRVALSALWLPDGRELKIIWTDLEATSMDEGTGWGTITYAYKQNTRPVIAFSHDGGSIVHACPRPCAPDAGYEAYTTPADLYVVPYGARAGGTPEVLQGANDPVLHEIYPALSPDDQYVAFARARDAAAFIGAGTEIWVLPFAGGAPTRLAANDPSSCTGLTSQSISNTWARFAPTVSVVGAKTYYWLVFESVRGNGGRIFVAPLVLENGAMTSYPALYPWPQTSGGQDVTSAAPDWAP